MDSVFKLSSGFSSMDNSVFQSFKSASNSHSESNNEDEGPPHQSHFDNIQIDMLTSDESSSIERVVSVISLPSITHSLDLSSAKEVEKITKEPSDMCSIGSFPIENSNDADASLDAMDWFLNDEEGLPSTVGTPPTIGIPSTVGIPSNTHTEMNESRDVIKLSFGSSASTRIVLDEIDKNDVQSCDILSGRGGLTNRNLGNKRFRQVVGAMKSKYRSMGSNSKGKEGIRNAIITYLKVKHGARFLQKISETKYREMTVDECQKKTSQALRETKGVKWNDG